MTRLCAALLVLFAAQAGAASDGLWQGEPLKDYIESLQQQGLRIIYSSNLILQSFRVTREPESSDPRQALKEILRPYKLTLREGPGNSILIVRPEEVRISLLLSSGQKKITGAEVAIDGQVVGRSDRTGSLLLPPISIGRHKITVAASGYEIWSNAALNSGLYIDKPLHIELLEAKPALAEVIVTSGLHRLQYRQPGEHVYLDRDMIARMPDLGDEAVRIISRLPSTAGGGISTRNHVRGGGDDEVLFLLDGLRLYEPYHLKDFQTVATIINASAIAGIDFYSGGFPVSYGDRMSGVMDISLREPTGTTETELAISAFNTSVLSIGNFGGDARGDWLVSARRGNLDLVFDLLKSQNGSPKYEDLLLHIGWDFGERAQFSINALASKDKIIILDTDAGEQADAQYDNRIVWFRIDSSWSDKLSSQTLISSSFIKNNRTGRTDAPGILSGAVTDNRRFRAVGLKQDWQYSPSETWMLSGGIDYKRLDADYRHTSVVTILPPFQNILDNRALVARDIDVSPSGSQSAVYLQARMQTTVKLTLDAGIRWDQQTYTTSSNDEQFSPRLSLLYQAGPATEIRIGWGLFHQAQEINELQVNDGLTEFFPAQRAEHLVANLSHTFRSGIDLRIAVYRKKIHAPRPRFENVFDPLVLIPELQIDRVRIDAISATAQGAEVSLNGGNVEQGLQWWASYAWTEVEDSVATGKIKRSWDQPHTVKAGMNWNWSQWNFSMAGIVHTGWPKTDVIFETIGNADGTLEKRADNTVRNNTRHHVFQSLDARISRSFNVAKGELTAFLEVSNLFDRQNSCCTEFRLTTDDDGVMRIGSKQSNWLPIIPSVGIIWRF